VTKWMSWWLLRKHEALLARTFVVQWTAVSATPFGEKAVRMQHNNKSRGGESLEMCSVAQRRYL
jgi:hypothetical protein